ncbi:MAG: ATP-dependent zinc metalloprotease FtsH [Deltaproteobacteria bacterium]|jgi:cell division protease FtsH|nr:ATP-dependent zinc metalloprotease FtsH [Deltaproteobacteria bacterium]
MNKDKKRLIFHAIYWAIGLFIIFGLPQLWLHSQTQEISYSQFKTWLKDGRILKLKIRPSEIRGLAYKGPMEGLPGIKGLLKNIEEKQDVTAIFNTIKTGSLQDWLKELDSNKEKQAGIILFQTVKVEDPKLVELLDQNGIDYSGAQESLLGQLFWGTLLPIMFWVGLWFLILRGMGKPGAGLLSIGKAKTKIDVEQDTGVRFDDVAGCEEAKEELKEVVQFLKEPQKFQALGAKIPKGVLLLGPPGTGKTLLAKALAGEAGTPFYSISGSEFVEMFVGVGAARVRDLFNQAKQNAPCIIFIDEIDAIGKFRSGGMMAGGHEEREQTLNQLLVEMDGFEPNIGVILLAATNRPEVLDPALMRPGRFDRQVILDAPDAKGREAILTVHSKGKPLAPDVNLKAIAMRTPGFSGADLANVVNEAALLAAREGLSQIHQKHMEDAVEKVMAGPERKSRRIGEKERRRVAVHEAGHAIVAFNCPTAPTVAKISIIPRGRAALGYTLQLPEEEQFLLTKSEMLDKICVSLGGRMAEEVMFNEISSGAQNDLEVATEMARGMVCRFGMSEKIGPLSLYHETNPFLKLQGMPGQSEAMSPELATEVDKEVRRILMEQQERARDILTNRKNSLEIVTEKLLQQEVMSAEEFKELAAQ